LQQLGVKRFNRAERVSTIEEVRWEPLHSPIAPHNRLMKRRLIFGLLTATALLISISPSAQAGRCNYPDDLDARGHRCGGRAASVRPGGYEPPPEYSTPPSTNSSGTSNRIPGWVFLTANDDQAHINVRESPSVNSPAPSYGVVGDRVWASETAQAGGYTWYHVGFPKTKASGWIRGDFVTTGIN
jgi:hypothetical protein